MLSDAEGLATSPSPRDTVPRGGWADARPLVEAPLTFLVETPEKPAIRIHPDSPVRERTGVSETRIVPIGDARPVEGTLSLDRQGFELRRHRTAVTDLRDDEAVRAAYYPEIERLVKTATGAAEVLVFDHTVRAEDAAANAGDAREPVRRVHNDYTERSGPQRVRDLLEPEAARRRLDRRFAQINVWRPMKGPVDRAPLAVADARTVRPEDLVAVDLVYPDRTGEIYEVMYNPAHRWYHVPRMGRDEVLLIKGYDSATDGRARFTPHTAFDHPATPADAAPRESIEVRVLAFFETDEGAAHWKENEP